MKKLNSVPKEALEAIQSEHERALYKIFQTNTYFCKLPVRVVKMNVRRQTTHQDNLEQVIVPETVIHVAPDGFLDEDTIDRDKIRYSIAQTSYPFPFGHIYKDSGHVCLGNIFVPSRISKHTPQQPLETLFLHNDRNLSHGNARLVLSKTTIDDIYDILIANNIGVSLDTQLSLHPEQNIISDDGLWLLGSDVLNETNDMRKAITIMSRIYNCIFTIKPELEKES